MNLLKGIGYGISIGLGVGIAIIIVAALIPAFQMACAFVQCDLNSCEKYACQVLECRGPVQHLDLTMTMVWSTIACTVIGAVWGGALTARDVHHSNLQKKARRDADWKANCIKNIKEVFTEYKQEADRGAKYAAELYGPLDNVEYQYDREENRLKRDMDEYQDIRMKTSNLFAKAKDQNGGEE